jgi:topoisomerase-4 subunit A
MMIVFPLNEIPTMKKGQGVTLQRFKDGSLTDLKVFKLSEGLKWTNGSKSHHLTDLKPWMSRRGGKGKTAPQGISRNNKFE